MIRSDVITIDGGSAVGKTTVSKQVAKKLGYDFISTGKIFRCLAFLLKQLNPKLFNDFLVDKIILLSDIEPIINDLIKAFAFEQLPDGKYKVNSLIIKDEELNSEEIAQVSSHISSFKPIRECYENIINNIIDNSQRGLIIEGRDCGSVICPESENKFFLQCSLQKQAENRMKDYKNTNIKINELKNLIKSRDAENKTRAYSPLMPAPDAVLIDCSELNIDQIINLIINTIQAKTKIKNIKTK